MLNVSDSKFRLLGCCVFVAALSMLTIPSNVAAQSTTPTGAQATAAQGTAAQLLDRIKELEQEVARLSGAAPAVAQAAPAQQNPPATPPAGGAQQNPPMQMPMLPARRLQVR
jgi:hypothetical protein